MISLYSGLDHCYGNECQYGECNALKIGYECKCKDGYKGKYCQGKRKENIFIRFILNL